MYFAIDVVFNVIKYVFLILYYPSLPLLLFVFIKNDESGEDTGNPANESKEEYNQHRSASSIYHR